MCCFHEIFPKKVWEWISVNSTPQCGKKISLTEQKFRQITYLIISSVKPLLSRNFCEKMWARISAISTLCCDVKILHSQKYFVKWSKNKKLGFTVIWFHEKNVDFIKKLSMAFDFTKKNSILISYNYNVWNILFWKVH